MLALNESSRHVIQEEIILHKHYTLERYINTLLLVYSSLGSGVNN